MADLKLARLPERTPVKLTIMISPDLAEQLTAYAEVYEATYSKRETIADLVPFMLVAFLASDREFHRVRHGRRKA
jgi:hypothetical protein